MTLGVRESLSPEESFLEIIFQSCELPQYPSQISEPIHFFFIFLLKLVGVKGLSLVT